MQHSLPHLVPSVGARAFPLVKLTDFGIARVAEDPGQTPLGAAVGTPHYVSPEQAMGRPATPASDVYSVGAMLYELLIGRRRTSRLSRRVR